jgi:hypothetical protein
LNTSNVLAAYSPGTPTKDAEASLSSFDSDGFTLDWTTADASPRVFWYLAIAGAASATKVGYRRFTGKLDRYRLVG